MIKKKLAAKDGFSMTELLVTVVIVSLLGIAVAAGISAAARAYRDVTMSSESSVLCGTLAIELADELRFAKDVQPDGSFTSARYGIGVSVDTNAAGHITIGGSQILSQMAYMGLSAAVTVDYTGSFFDVTITISSPGGGDLRSSTFCITPIAGI